MLFLPLIYSIGAYFDNLVQAQVLELSDCCYIFLYHKNPLPLIAKIRIVVITNLPLA